MTAVSSGVRQYGGPGRDAPECQHQLLSRSQNHCDPKVGCVMGINTHPRAPKAARARKMPAETRMPDGPRYQCSGCAGIHFHGAKRKDIQESDVFDPGENFQSV